MPSATSDTAGALRLLGLARRAGSVATGVGATRDALRRGRARLVVTAGDASEVQLEKVEKALGSVPRRVLGSREALGTALGTASTTAAAVVDRGLAEAILRLLHEPGPAEAAGMHRRRSGPVALEDD